MSNSLVRDHLPVTYFFEYQQLRDQLIELLDDADLKFRMGGASQCLGELCREIGEIEHSYIESFKTFNQNFRYRNHDPSLETSTTALAAWYSELDMQLMEVLNELTEEDIDTHKIARSDFDFDDFAPLPRHQIDTYREALLIFYGKVSVYLRAMGKTFPRQWIEWIG
ncbi:MAG: DinB family protein [Candidatus Dormibacterales bacterium]